MTTSFVIPKRILMTADTVGGVWTYAMELCRALGKYGVEIMLATMGAPLRRDQRAEAGSLWNVEVFESDYKLEWMNDPWRDVDCAGDWLLQLEDRFEPDVVHLNQFSFGALPSRVPKIVVGHSCVLSWWQATKGCEASAEWNEYRTRVLEGLALANFVVAPSEAMLTALQEHYGPFAANGIVPNGRSFSRCRSSRKLDLVLGAGRLWDEAKNVAALARVASQLPWPVYLAGENRHPDGQETKFSQVRFLGWQSQPELQVWFERASIFAAPAQYEPFGLGILEAALAGCALVLGDIPSLRENWNDAALFVAPKDTTALEAAIKKLIGDPMLRQKLTTRSQYVAAQLKPERMAENYLVVYSEMLTKARFETSPLLRQTPAPVILKGASCI
jgi:glycosyltransferase involved in cell wall biosynthesis